MNVRSEILDQFKEVAHELYKRLVPLSYELPLMDLVLDSLSFSIFLTRLVTLLGVDLCSEKKILLSFLFF